MYVSTVLIVAALGVFSGSVFGFLAGKRFERWFPREPHERDWRRWPL